MQLVSVLHSFACKEHDWKKNSCNAANEEPKVVAPHTINGVGVNSSPTRKGFNRDAALNADVP